MKREFDIQKIVQAIKSVLPGDSDCISLHEPVFTGNEWLYVKECLDTGWVSSAGKFVDLFEEKLVEFTGVKKAVAVVNGTAALHICLKLVGVVPGDEVLVPALTFVATANAVTYCDAVPHFVDSEERTLGLDPFKLEMYLREMAEARPEGCFNKKTGRRIKAVVPMHTFGHPVDLDPLVEICQRYRLELVEDAAESLGSYYKGRHTGNWGKVSALSFNGNKIVTTGGGGAILTNDERLGRLAKHITTTARVPHKWAFNHDMVGYNYRLPNINAALGCAQLEQLPAFIKKKRRLAERYRETFSGIEGVSFFTEPEFARSNYWLNVLLLDEKYSRERDNILERTNTAGIKTRPAWVLMHKLHIYEDSPKMDLRTAENLARRLINIPSSAFLGEEDE
ncbi:MAG: LegC family aminotransferase [Peptococcaceae bacterium]|nr:LegC family aminotransferase [Peptococcaceae bacterium]